MKVTIEGRLDTLQLRHILQAVQTQSQRHPDAPISVRVEAPEMLTVDLRGVMRSVYPLLQGITISEGGVCVISG